MESILDNNYLIKRAFAPHSPKDIPPNPYQGYDIEIANAQGEDELIDMVADVRTMGDSEFRIYAESDISIVSLDISYISPMSYYLLEQGLNQQRGFHSALREKYGLDLFQLKGRLEYDQNDNHHAICPPIVEKYIEEDGSLVYGLIDGTHRVYVARELGYQDITVILINNVLLPPYAMPVEWDKVKVMKKAPPTNFKKKFRDLKKVIFPKEVRQDPTVDSKYLLYRDYSRLGSNGVR